MNLKVALIIIYFIEVSRANNKHNQSSKEIILKSLAEYTFDLDTKLRIFDSSDLSNEVESLRNLMVNRNLETSQVYIKSRILQIETVKEAIVSKVGNINLSEPNLFVFAAIEIIMDLERYKLDRFKYFTLYQTKRLKIIYGFLYDKLGNYNSFDPSYRSLTEIRFKIDNLKRELEVALNFHRNLVVNEKWHIIRHYIDIYIARIEKLRSKHMQKMQYLKNYQEDDQNMSLMILYGDVLDKFLEYINNSKVYYERASYAQNRLQISDEDTYLHLFYDTFRYYSGIFERRIKIQNSFNSLLRIEKTVIKSI
jgi:hypothetical protein